MEQCFFRQESFDGSRMDEASKSSVLATRKETPLSNVKAKKVLYNTYTHTPVEWPFFRDYPGEPVPEW